MNDHSDQNPLRMLQHEGQSVWIDFIRRSLVESGELEQLVEEDGVSGLTSNPKIFMKAIAESDEYDRQIEELIADDPEIATSDLYEALAVADVQAAADVLRPVYDRTEGADGFVSLEVSPALAYETSASRDEARRLWAAVDRPNVLIKLPATEQGIPAIEDLLAEGINVNITLMFSLQHYEAVSQAYLRAMARSRNPQHTASVASFFISRITRAVDDALDEVGSDDAMALKGQIAIANAKATYRRFQRRFASDEFESLQAKGAQVQRVLWASTSTKNPKYSDVLYVEELIGPETISTMPPQTLQAFRDHGTVRGATVLEGFETAGAQLTQLQEIGVDLGEITQRLQEEGVKKFRDPFEKLLAALEDKRRQIQHASSA